MPTPQPYLIELFWSTADGGYIAIAPDLPGCSAYGDTQQEAVSEIQDAINGWLAACVAMGRTIPKPTAQAQTQLNAA